MHNKFLKLVLSCSLLIFHSSIFAQSYEYFTDYPTIRSNISTRENIGWIIRRVKVTDQELTVLFQVSVSSGYALKSPFEGMSSLMYLGEWNDDVRNLIKQDWNNYYSYNAQSFWTKIRLGSPQANWVIKAQSPSIYVSNNVASYWNFFSQFYTVKDTRTNNDLLIEVVFPPVSRGIEEITIVDYFNGNRFEGIQIENPVKKGIQTGFTENSLKQHWNQNGIDEIEGIYDEIGYDKYKLALKKEGDENYNLIYLSGGSSSWAVGEVKAVITRTATPSMFKVLWYMGDKSENNGVYAMFEQGSFKLLGLNENETIFLKLFPSVSGSGGVSGTGTGFALNSLGYIVTNYHVVENSKSINVKGINGNFETKYKAEVVITDKKNDLAIIKITDINFTSLNIPPYTFSNVTSNVASKCYALGYPMTQIMGNEIKFTDGTISSKTGYQGDVSTYQISVPIQPGNSGGPLFAQDGKVIGITNAKIPGAENVSYAIKTSNLIQLIELMPTPIKLPAINKLVGLTVSQQYEKVKNFVYLIEVE